MEILRLLEPNGLGVKIAVLAAIVAATDFTLKKFGAKIPRFVVNYSPLVVAVLGSVIAELITSGKLQLTKDVFYGGFAAYSVGTVISVAVRKLLRGESDDNVLLTLVTSIAKNICANGSGADCSEIVRILSDLTEKDTEETKVRIITILKKAAKENVSDAEILATAEMILLSAQNLKKEK